MKANLKIAIVEPSVMVRMGLSALLRKLPGMQLSVVEILMGEKTGNAIMTTQFFPMALK